MEEGEYMWLIIFFGFGIIFATYSGLPQPWEDWIKIISTIGLIASIIGCMVGRHRSRKRRMKARPVYSNYNGSYSQFKVAQAKWDESHTPPLSSLPLVERLKKRNPKRHGFFDRGGERISYCFVCGDGLNSYDECPSCSKRYINSPKVLLPEGISEDYRRALWNLQQAIMIDVLDGVLNETDAAEELQEAIEVIKQRKIDMDSQRKQQKELQLLHEREQQEMIKISERLLTK